MLQLLLLQLLLSLLLRLLLPLLPLQPLPQLRQVPADVLAKAFPICNLTITLTITLKFPMKAFGITARAVRLTSPTVLRRIRNAVFPTRAIIRLSLLYQKSHIRVELRQVLEPSNRTIEKATPQRACNSLLFRPCTCKNSIVLMRTQNIFLPMQSTFRSFSSLLGFLLARRHSCLLELLISL